MEFETFSGIGRFGGESIYGIQRQIVVPDYLAVFQDGKAVPSGAGPGSRRLLILFVPFHGRGKIQFSLVTLEVLLSQTILLQCFINGLSMGLTYSLMALGLTLIFGMMHIVNFAHGEFLMLGRFLFILSFRILWLELLSQLLFDPDNFRFFLEFFSKNLFFGPSPGR